MVRLNSNRSEIAKTHYQLTVEECDKEGFSYEEITEIAKGSDSMNWNIIFLAQSLIKSGVGI